MYWFIMYRWRTQHTVGWNFSEHLTDEDPVDWLVNQREMHQVKELPNGKMLKYKYYLTGWHEVSKEIYEKHKYNVG